MSRNSCPRETQSKWRRALVVDVIAATRESTGVVLSDLGGQIMTTGNGAEALEIVQLARNSNLDFDLAVTDVQMSMMSMIEATRRTRQQGFSGVIIAVSGSNRRIMRDICMETGCNEFVSKPATPENLGSIVCRCCSDWAVHSHCQQRMSIAAPVATHKI
jgi:CheY-like chemotaxis protein